MNTSKTILEKYDDNEKKNWTEDKSTKKRQLKPKITTTTMIIITIVANKHLNIYKENKKYYGRPIHKHIV